jgi:phospholipid/cholesterol/gamma-HCH transport system substrate-binding protein
MEREANYTAVGAFVILITVMAGLFVYWYADSSDSRDYQRYEIYFPGSVSGLSEGGPVRYLGVDVGRVRTIRLDTRSADRVQVVADIDNSTPISEDTTAKLSLQGVTGLLFIDLRENADQRDLMLKVPSVRYPVISTVPSDFETFLASLPGITGRIGELLERAQVIFSAENTEALAAMVQNLKVASDGLPATGKRVDDLLRELSATGMEVRRFAQLLNETAPGMTESVGEMTKAVAATAANLEKATAGIEELISENRAGLTGFTQDGLPELERTLREARAAAAQFGELARALSEDPSRILFQPNENGVQVPR